MKNKKNSVLIFGITGLLGSTLYNYFKLNKNMLVYGVCRKTPNNKIYSKYKSEIIQNLDVNNNQELNEIFLKLRPKFVINCIGLIKSKINSRNISQSFIVNSLFPKKLSFYSEKFNYKLIHISTDCVFSGKRGGYFEKDIPDAEDIYGISKLLGETLTKNSMIIRTSIIGHHYKDKSGLLEWFLSQKKEIRGYSKAYFSGFTTLELSKILFKNIILKNRFYSGVYHLSSRPIDKYTLLKKISKLYKKEIIIQKDNSVVIDRTLNSKKLKKIIGYKTKSWDNMLKEMKNIYFYEK